MWPDVAIDVEVGPVRAIPVLVTTVDVPLLLSDGYLVGWSLREASGDVPKFTDGSVTSPTAGQTICITPGLQAGLYTVNWEVALEGTLAAADADNFAVFMSVTQQQASINDAVAGAYP